MDEKLKQYNNVNSSLAYMVDNLRGRQKKIQAAISLAALRLPKLNFPMDMAMVFSTVWMMS